MDPVPGCKPLNVGAKLNSTSLTLSNAHTCVYIVCYPANGCSAAGCSCPSPDDKCDCVQRGHTHVKHASKKGEFHRNTITYYATCCPFNRSIERWRQIECNFANSIQCPRPFSYLLVPHTAMGGLTRDQWVEPRTEEQAQGGKKTRLEDDAKGGEHIFAET